MKTLAFLAALSLTSAAFAQDAPDTPPAPPVIEQPSENPAPPSVPMKSTGDPAIDALYQQQLQYKPPPVAPTPGQPVNFLPSVPVDQAFPPPPPKAEYPVCSKGQTDGCINPYDIAKGEAPKPARPAAKPKPKN